MWPRFRWPILVARSVRFFGRTRYCPDAREALRILRTINGKVNMIMSAQENLDAFVVRIDAATAGIRADIADLKTAVQAGDPVDFSALEARVAGLEGLDAENPEAPA